jgi:multidrug transporter EmrE-like cation transporter
MTRVSPMVMLFIALTIAFTVVGQLFVKKGMLEVGSSPADVTLLPRFVLQALTNLRVMFGLACAVVAAISWTVAISRSDLSFAYPFTGLSAVLVLALSGALFGESVLLGRWLGVGIVCLGLFVAARAG